MIYERDYIKRLIRDMARMLARLLLGIDTSVPAVELLEDGAVKQTAFGLLSMADDGDIAGAEALLRRMLESGEPGFIDAALVFYSHLNEKSDAFLEAHGFPREKIEEGLRRTAEAAGLEGLLPM